MDWPQQNCAPPPGQNWLWGVGFLIKDSLLDHVSASILDNSVEDVLWLQLRGTEVDFVYNMCVCYLPPEGSSRHVDVEDFYDNLLCQVYSYNNSGSFFICGDLNSRLGDRLDFTEGVDDVAEREVLDFTRNRHGEYLADFLISSSCCVLNGRDNVKNDFTSFNTAGQSVVDYCAVPAEALECFTEFRVLRPLDLINAAGVLGRLQSLRGLPDHALLCWKMNWSVTWLTAPVTGVTAEVVSTYKRYELSSVPDDFLMSEDSKRQIRQVALNIQRRETDQNNLDAQYQEFCDIVTNEMDRRLVSKTVKLQAGGSNKKRKVKQPWWTPRLTELWNEFCVADTRWRKSKGVEKMTLKADMKCKQKSLDKAIQFAKRRYWREKQNDMLTDFAGDRKRFWRKVGRLGRGAINVKPVIPMEVMDDQGLIHRDHETVLGKWENDFSGLLNADVNTRPTTAPMFRPRQVGPLPDNQRLNVPIEFAEVMRVVRKAKLGKAQGFDGIPTECIKGLSAVSFMFLLFRKCFDTGMIPGVWKKGIINPIPKNVTADPRVPLNYRGITLSPVMYKLYCGVLNNRLSDWAENCDMLEDEQNGFRRGRSCQDHLSTLSSIIECRKAKKLSTFAVFIDFSKAYDRINRDLLFQKIEKLGVHGRFIGTLRSMYSNVECAVRINGLLTNWFPVNTGLKQGCLLSPLLFNLYLNDLIQEVKDLNLGVDVNDENVSILCYADDIVLLAENEHDLQVMLSRLHNWCDVWKMKVNGDKTKVVHFRTKSAVRTQFDFRCGELKLDVVEQYKYLGMIFTEFLDFERMAKAVSECARRALGSLIAKDKAHGGMPFDVFTHLYNSLVQPIIDFGAGIWGSSRDYDCIDSIQNRACRYFLGVNRYAPTAAVRGDMGWAVPAQRKWICVTRLYCRLAGLSDTRLNNRVFKWARDKARAGQKNWVFRTESLYGEMGLLDPLELEQSNFSVLAENVRDYFNLRTQASFTEELQRVQARRGAGLNKLRTYRNFKAVFQTEDYVKLVDVRAQRRALAQFRLGVAPIRLETGRYERGRHLPVDQRTCYVCTNAVESELHVIIDCPLYTDFREDLFSYCNDANPQFNDMVDLEKLNFVLSSPFVAKTSAKFLSNVLKRRRVLVYTT